MFSTKNKTIKSILYFISLFILYIAIQHFLIPHYHGYQYDSKLQKYSIYKTIATYYPEEYHAFIKQLTRNRVNDINNSAMELTNYVMEKSVPFASSKALYNYLKINYEFEKKLYATNPLLVLYLEFPARVDRKSIETPLKQITETQLNEVMQAKADIIESGAKNKSPLHLSEDEKEKISATFLQLYAEVTKKYGENIVMDTFQASGTFKDPAQSAQALLYFYELILSKGEDEGSLLFKSLYIK